jgi:Protein of unknown function (DUF3891)
MIVTDSGDDWQIVLQPDHAAFAGALAAAWEGGGSFARGSRPDSLETAARRHDDGWLIWERAPRLNGQTAMPLNFFELDPAIHLSFYRACIDSVADQDPYAGRLIGMHCAGIYRSRYGTDPGLITKLDDQTKDLVDEFVYEEERLLEWSTHHKVFDESAFWSDYKLLQVFDRLALIPPTTDWSTGPEESFQSVPLAAGGDGEMRATVIGPGIIGLDPCPFGEPLETEILRRLIPKASCASDAELVATMAVTAPEPQRITLRPLS